MKEIPAVALPGLQIGRVCLGCCILKTIVLRLAGEMMVRSSPILMVAVFSACVFESGTSVCQDGLRCPPGSVCAAAQEICITDACGDGFLGEGEVCDDGNKIDGDNCSADCLSTEVCGNGIVDYSVGEECDDGDRVSGDECLGNCRLTTECGDNVVDGEEVCDDGNRVSGDGCSADCSSEEACGNGVIDVAIGEVCDDGNKESGDGCTANCRSDETCPNGYRDEGEDCDTGGDSASCNSDCTAPVCGDGHVNLVVEDCEPDAVDGGAPVNSADCNWDCTAPVCGDGLYNPEAGETCDTAGDTESCDADCTAAECGDRYRNSVSGEYCDDGGVDTVNCDFDCSRAYCGDRYRNSARGEYCDEGGVDTMNCDFDCTSADCGDGYPNSARGEECDQGTNNADMPDRCRTNCRLPRCGDNIQDSGEACDGNCATGYVCIGCQSCQPM
ncbi:DUF4215 domain-containing protein [Haliangium sp.]|uniref:DUF4215 domain-containing protein n=2 Tax=Haliangium sp. TaxID=2663208 RepID=UPI003D12C387